MSHKFKVGDKVRIVSKSVGYTPLGSHLSRYPKESTIEGVFNDEHYGQRLRCYTVNGNHFAESDLVLINSLNSMSITEKFITALLPEPEKSLRKAGITNGDGLLTEDGQTIFLTFLLNDKETQKKFNEEVVQPLLKEQEKEA